MSGNFTWQWVGVLTLCAFSCFSVSAEEPIEEPENRPIAKIENYRELDKFRDEKAWAEQIPEGSKRIVAFSASGTRKVSEGAAEVIAYDYKTYTNTHPRSWIEGGSHFRAPVAGLYLFNLSFTREKQTNELTKDDVEVIIFKDGEPQGGAFAGPQDDPNPQYTHRETAAYSVALLLEKDAVVHTAVYDQDKGKRRIIQYNFTGVLIEPSAQ